MPDLLRHGGTTLALYEVDTLPHVETALAQHGAVLVRGLGITSPDGFGSVVRTFGEPATSYRGGNTPRDVVASGVFTSTEYPPRYPISQHNELSYAQQWPDRLFFACLVSAESGGATPVCDGRALLADLDPVVQQRFIDLGVEYRQHLHGGFGFGKSWQDTFETADRAVVERFLTASDAEFSWTADGDLRVSQRRPATRVHPRTGEQVWFNQAEQWHVSNLPGEDADLLLEAVGGTDNLPHNAYYGNGDAISAADLAAVRETTRRHTLAVPWQAGDLLIVDNMLVQHGREAYTGDRRVLVGMV
ncbi:TauD/TfdA family dioxygenase [Actinokineospora diospyrosa]|uniref:Taurine dioxygenase, alpha-ketoglutarate-dependent n=1 Tax=Actinokineospora diospyrosa TaxID=103728 RepID=A0ABT1I608_9PSEU|nr:TauD/TfdA family dioxygenase [Actinokineospora diospyrosa]MCP2268011.1 Taurine dioxygenase, alpha-ketoglutarate-dependent [Actinokineospora diospyrosa]